MSEETVTFNLEVNVEKAHSTIRQIEFLIFRVLGLLKRLGLPEEIDAAIMKIQRLTMTVRILHSAMVAMQATTPIGLALGAVALVAGGLTLGDTIYELTNG